MPDPRWLENDVVVMLRKSLILNPFRLLYCILARKQPYEWQIDSIAIRVNNDEWELYEFSLNRITRRALRNPDFQSDDKKRVLPIPVTQWEGIKMRYWMHLMMITANEESTIQETLSTALGKSMAWAGILGDIAPPQTESGVVAISIAVNNIRKSLCLD